jgi:hypothetical protein
MARLPQGITLLPCGFAAAAGAGLKSEPMALLLLLLLLRAAGAGLKCAREESLHSSATQPAACAQSAQQHCCWQGRPEQMRADESDDRGSVISVNDVE